MGGYETISRSRFQTPFRLQTAPCNRGSVRGTDPLSAGLEGPSNRNAEICTDLISALLTEWRTERIALSKNDLARSSSSSRRRRRSSGRRCMAAAWMAYDRRISRSQRFRRQTPRRPAAHRSASARARRLKSLALHRSLGWLSLRRKARVVPAVRAKAFGQTL